VFEHNAVHNNKICKKKHNEIENYRQNIRKNKNKTKFKVKGITQQRCYMLMKVLLITKSTKLIITLQLNAQANENTTS
jgi:hypothetical protein